MDKEKILIDLLIFLEDQQSSLSDVYKFMKIEKTFLFYSMQERNKDNIIYHKLRLKGLELYKERLIKEMLQ